MELMQASRQWASRPTDERFTSLTALHAHAWRKKSSRLTRSSCAPQRLSTPAIISKIAETFKSEEGRDAETLWDATTAVTAYAKTIQHQDERVAIEREGGKILDLVAVR